MGIHGTKIIEFYGLPGSGKTTLCVRLKDVFEKMGYRVGLLSDTVISIGFSKLLSLISFHDLLLFIRLVIKLSWAKVPNNLVLSPIRRILRYKQIKRTDDYDFLFIEHGVVQSMVRALLEVQSPLVCLHASTEKSILKLVPAEGFVYCKLTSDEAFLRVRSRNRKNSGTFDQYPDESLRMVLEKHSPIFEEIRSIVSDCFKYSTEVDCSCSIDCCVHDLTYFINESFCRCKDA